MPIIARCTLTFEGRACGARLIRTWGFVAHDPGTAIPLACSERLQRDHGAQSDQRLESSVVVPLEKAGSRTDRSSASLGDPLQRARRHGVVIGHAANGCSGDQGAARTLDPQCVATGDASVRRDAGPGEAALHGLVAAQNRRDITFLNNDQVMDRVSSRFVACEALSATLKAMDQPL